MVRLFLTALFFLPFISHAAFWDNVGQSDFFKSVSEQYIPTRFSGGEETKSASTSAFTSQWETLKRDTKEKAGIDLTKFFHWLMNSLAKLFSWLAAFLARLSSR